MTISVTQLNNYIKGMFDIDSILGNVSVAGEVTNLKRYGEGWYFSLKDETSAINCFCYADVPLAQGNIVVAEGNINYFGKTGSVSFFVKRLTTTTDTGDAYKRFVQLRDKLQAEGLFDVDRKITVPSICDKIGIVTSQSGAVIVDITNVALRRQPWSNLYLYPVKVQGEGADLEIVKGIQYFSNTDVDVIIVGRGGGSNEDLSVFNSEIIVRAISNCKKPVVSAVGHGVDYTLCDFVADRRAVTPSEAAEFVTTDVSVLKNKVLNALSFNSNKTHNLLDLSKQKIKAELRRISAKVEHNLVLTRSQVKSLLDKTHQRTKFILDKNKLALNNAIQRISAVNPANVLKRGYALVTVDGERISSLSQIEVGDKVKIDIADGSVQAIVSRKEE